MRISEYLWGVLSLTLTSCAVVQDRLEHPMTPSPTDVTSRNFGNLSSVRPVANADTPIVLGQPRRESKAINLQTLEPSDSDGEGTLYVADLCPFSLENRNGFEDQDGCYDEIPADLQSAVKSYHFTNREWSKFKSDFSDRLDVRLERIALVLGKYPSVKIEIVVHNTPILEGTFSSKNPTDHWSHLMRRFITNLGIDTSRIFCRGAGPYEPIRSNDTAEGQRQNRRVEFVIIVD